MTKKTPEKLTRRHIDNLRSESMRYAAILLARLRMSVIGKPAIGECECGAEYEVFPDQPKSLSVDQVNAAKYEVSKIYPDLKDEDIDKVVDKKSPEEMWDDQAKQMKGDMKHIYTKELAKRGIFITFGNPQLEDVSVNE